MIYLIQYIAKSGAHITQTITDPEKVKNKLINLMKQQIEAIVYKSGGDISGRVWKDNSQRIKWNYIFDAEYSIRKT